MVGEAPASGSTIDAQLDFEKHLANIYDEFTANVSTVQVKLDESNKPMLDGFGNPIVEVVSKPRAYSHPICNDEGGQMLVHNLRLVMNRHNAFADLDRDEIAQIARDAIMQPIDTMMFNAAMFGVTDLSRLETEGLALFDSVYLYLSQLKLGEFKKAVQNILTVQYSTRPNMPQAQAEPQPSLYLKPTR